ncbi:MAG TPA: efflux RND transporter permease subunit [Sphingomonadaceae bacterium]|nr:efflux RND transporter permease subunit [Sphingomonadaceae bacterium]
MLPRYFIERPIFAWVLAIMVMALGTIAVFTLPVAQYPDIAPPTINVRANYNGASAKTVEDSVTQILEQQLSGIDNMLYFSSTSSSSGQARITITFAKGTNPDTAQVQVQDRVNQALSRMPQEVQQQGITVRKSNVDQLMVIAVYDETDQRSTVDISDYLVSNIQDPVSRVNGVGEFNVFGAQYAIRIWLDPHKLNAYQLMPSDVEKAVQAQNTQVTAGELGELPAAEGQALTATVTALSRLQTPEQFENIILKTQPDGSSVRVRDVARVEMGSESYTTSTQFNGHPATGISVQLAPGANALQTAENVRATVDKLAKNFPHGLKVAYPRDMTPFVKISVTEVVKTLIEAIILVVAVMFLFLQSWRATLIPAIAVPVVLLGTFGVIAIAGFSINTLTLFGMVLAIGLLVDDAIVVVENVERVMHEEKLDAKAATIRSMGEISGALIGIALVLGAVFVPMAFFGGSTGVIYKQFSITIAAAMALSVLVALTLSPALCATFLKPIDHDSHGRFFHWFNTNFEKAQERYRARLTKVIERPRRWLFGFAVVIALVAILFHFMPTSFLPQEDQGQISIQFTLPSGAPQSRTLEVGDQIARYFREKEKDTVDGVFLVFGNSQAGSGQNAGQGFVQLKPWDERHGAANSAAGIIARANKAFRGLRTAKVNFLSPAPIRGLGQTGGFDFWLQDASSEGREKLIATQKKLLADAADNPKLSSVRINSLEDKPELHIEIDQAKASALGLAQADINSTLSSAWGGNYINDFIDRGRVKRVYMQGDAPYRSAPEDIDNWFVRGSSGNMAPFSAFAEATWRMGPQVLQRFNGLSAIEIQGSGAGRTSSGTAMEEMAKLAANYPAYSIAWSGLSYQEQLSSGQAPLLYAASIFFIFLCLAALYESWSIPTAVMLVIPLGVIGALLAATLRGLNNDIFFQVGLLTTIGLSAKNAILIVEFAETERRAGKSPREAAIEGARIRLRPILMTSLAFIAGVMPLVISAGAGAASRHDIGTGVVGGMISATILAIFFVPLFFVLVNRILGRGVKHAPAGEN